jgi:hypothetical protein
VAKIDIQNELYRQFNKIRDIEANLSDTQKLEIPHVLEALMKKGDKKEEYSATVATTILNNTHKLIK